MTMVKLRIEPSFYVFWAIFCLLDNEEILLLFLGAAVIHETGHLLAIYACGGDIRRIVLSAAGAELQQSRSLGYMADTAIALAGPAAGMAAAWVFSAKGYPMFAGANVLLSVFNCLPVLPLDGGCACYSVISMTSFALVGRRGLEYFSIAAAIILTLCGAAFLLHTRRNATGLIVGLCLLRANRDLLRKSVNCGMIQLNHTIHLLLIR